MNYFRGWGKKLNLDWNKNSRGHAEESRFALRGTLSNCGKHRINRKNPSFSKKMSPTVVDYISKDRELLIFIVYM